MSTTQKALVLTKKFGNFEVVDVPVSSPGPQEVLVKIEAAALNPVDWKIQDFGVFIEKFPAILGSDAAGEVVELGEGVTNVAIGDKVLFQSVWFFGDNGTAGFQQYARADAHTIAKIPSNITVQEAATIPAALTSAFVGLYNSSPYGLGFEKPYDTAGRGKYAGQPIFIFGGAGSVGKIVINLAHASGFSPIITTASLKNAEALKAMGATHVLDRNLSSDDVKASLKDILGDTPLLAVYDCVSSPDIQQLGLEILAPGGKVVILGHKAVQATDGKEAIQMLGAKGIPHNVALIRELYTKLTGLLEEGVIKPSPVEILPGGLSAILGGLERLRKGAISGTKLVVLPQETA